MKTTDQFKFQYTNKASGSPIRFFWNGKNFLTLKEAKSALKNLTTVIETAKKKSVKK